jgi:hypothetical protein
MDNIKNNLVNECITVLKREDVKENIKNLMKPVINLILVEIYPYIYISIIFVSLGFLLILVTMILLMRIYKITTVINKLHKNYLLKKN